MLSLDLLPNIEKENVGALQVFRGAFASLIWSFYGICVMMLSVVLRGVLIRAKVGKGAKVLVVQIVQTIIEKTI